MDTKTTQLDFKILVDQTLNSLEKFDAVSRCDALHYLLRNLKYKYPEACQQVIPVIFPQTVTQLTDDKKHLQLLLPTKKEECIKNEDENASTDLNQNFEKILCKEEFMCLDEDDNAYADDSSSLSKRMRYGAANVARSTLRTTGGTLTQQQQQQQTVGDPLDLIPSSVIHARRLGRIATADAEADESNSLDALGPDTSLKRSRRRAFGGPNAQFRAGVGKFPASRLPLLVDKLQRVSHLGEGYVFHEDNEFTVHFHYSSENLGIRVFKEQFRLHLKTALKRHDKEFLKEFQREFVFSGLLLGTTPPKHVLEKLRAEHLEEWQQQKLRKQQLLQQQQLQLQQLQQQQQHHQMMLMQQRRRMLAGSMSAASGGNAYDSEMEFELETESQLSSASQEIMKFEEIIDEGVGPGRLIDGLVMEPEMDDVIGGGSGASVSGGSGSSNSSGGNGLDSIPNDMATNDSAASGFAGDNSANGRGAPPPATAGPNFKNHLSQQQHGPNNALLMNGLNTSLANNIIPNNINQQQQQHANSQNQQQLQATTQGNSLANMAPKEQQPNPQHQLQAQPQIISNQQLSMPHNHKMSLMNNDKQQQQQPHVNNLMNNMGQPPPTQQQQQPPHFQHQQQRFMMQQQQQQQNHYNSHMQAQNHPLAMMGGMMESANQQHQQQMQAQRMQLNASNNMINSIDNILGGAPATNKPTPPHANAENMQQYMQQHQQQLPPHMQNMPPQQQQHMLLQQQQQQQQQQALLGGSTLTPSTTPTSSMSMMPNSSTTPTGNSSANASFEHDDEGLSHDEDDDDHENDTNDGMETKQQLIDGGSSSSTSLQAPSGAGNSSTPGAKKEKPSYNCLLCPKSYRKRKSLLDHYKIHPGYCHDCGKPNGTTLEEIIHHNRTVHAKEFPFVCETCGESYSRRQQFHAHVESHNKKEFKSEFVSRNVTDV